MRSLFNKKIAVFVSCTCLFLSSYSFALEKYKEQTFDIPTTSLSEALSIFLIQADVQILFRSDAVAGKYGNRVVGQYTVGNALESLLADTGLKYQESGHRTIVISPIDPATDSSDNQINSVHWYSNPDHIPEIITAAHARSGECCLSHATTLTKTFAPPEHIPKSSEGLSQGKFTSSGNVTISDIFDDYSSVVVTDKKGNLALRGFTLSARSLLISGRPIVSTGIVDMPINNIETVEIAKGSSSALYGYGQPNGLVNFIAKEPNPSEETSVVLSTGNNDQSVSIDSNITFNDQFWSRITAFHHEDGKASDNGVSQTQLAPTFKFLTGNGGIITTGLDLVKQNTNGDDSKRPFEKPLEASEFFYNLITPDRPILEFYPSSAASQDVEQEFESGDFFLRYDSELFNGWQQQFQVYYGESKKHFAYNQDLNIWLNTLITPSFGYKPLALIIPFNLQQNQTNAISQFLDEMERVYPVPDSNIDIEAIINDIADLMNAFIPTDPTVIDQNVNATVDFLRNRESIFDVMNFIYGAPFEDIDRWNDDEVRFYYRRSSGEELRERGGFDLNFTNQFEVGATSHELLFGLSYFKRVSEQASYIHFNKELYDLGTKLISLGNYRQGYELRRLSHVHWYDPYQNNAEPMATLPLLTAQELDLPVGESYAFNDKALQLSAITKTKSIGLYIQDHIDLSDHWKLLGSLGYYHYKRNVFHKELNTYGHITGDRIYISSQDDPEDDIYTPSIGITYLPVKQLSLFASYGKQFDIIEGATILNKSFKPEKTQSYEIGAMWRGENSLHIDWSYFYLIKTNWLTNDATSNGLIQRGGELVADGYEFSVSGFLTPYVETSINYAENAVEANNNGGSIPINRIGQPERYATSWFKYHSHSFGVTGWSTGLGLQYIGPREYNVQDILFTLESSLLLNLNITYKSSDLVTTLAIDNLFDEEWFVGSSYRPTDYSAPRYLAPGYGQRVRLIFDWKIL